MIEQAYIEPTRAYYRRALGVPNQGDDKQPSEFSTTSVPEYMEAVTHLGKVARILKTLGIETTISGGRKPGSRWTALKVASTGQAFTVRHKPNTTRPQAVSGTSREAYTVVDFSTSRGRVLNAIYEATKEGHDITRAEIAAALSMEKSSVSGRVNELFEMCESGPVKIGEVYYRLATTQTRVSDVPGANVKNEAFRLVQTAPYNFKETQAAQASLF